MNRPFFRSSIIEIENEYQKRSLGESIEDIIYELSFRNSRRAKKLYNKIKDSNTKIDIQAEKKEDKNYYNNNQKKEIGDELDELLSSDNETIRIDDE